MIFKETIMGWDSWGRVFDSIEAFSSLSRVIFQKEGLVVNEDIQNLKPGSNAVFKADNFVIKIFAPKESGVDTEGDYITELSVMKFAMQKGIPVPKIIAFGELDDKYLFRYIIMEYILADVSIEELLTFSLHQKKEFVNQIKNMTFSLHQPFENFPKNLDLKKQDIRTERLKGLSPSLIEELSICLKSQDLSHNVLVHGDITRDNILLSSNGTLTLIDFADCIVAPDYYELPAIIFELFLCDKELISMFIGDTGKDEFLETLIKGLSLHIYCGNILKDYFKRLDIPIDTVKSVNELKQLLHSQFFS